MTRNITGKESGGTYTVLELKDLDREFSRTIGTKQNLSVPQNLVHFLRKSKISVSNFRYSPILGFLGLLPSAEIMGETVSEKGKYVIKIQSPFYSDFSTISLNLNHDGEIEPHRKTYERSSLVEAIDEYVALF